MSLFTPGINLLNNMGFARKFQLLFIVFLLPVGYGAITIYNNQMAVIDAADGEVRGYDAYAELHPLRVLAAKHRGTAAQWLNGNAAAKSDLAGLERDIDKQFEVADASLKKQGFSFLNSKLHGLQSDFADLNSNKLEALGSAASFKQHTDWIQEMSALIEELATESGLILDPYLDTYLLMQLSVYQLPAVQEFAGQLRGRGAGVAAKGSFTPESFLDVTRLYNAILSPMQLAVYQVNKAVEFNPAMGGKVQQALAQAQRDMDSFLKMTDEHLIKSEQVSVDSGSYFAAGTQAIGSVAALNKEVMALFHQRSVEYETAAQQHLLWTVVLFLLLLGLAMYLLMCLKKSVDYSTRLVKQMADDLEHGQLNKEYSIGGSDELSWVVNALGRSFRQLASAVGNVSQQAANLTATSNQLQTASKTTRVLGQQQKDQVSLIVSAATELAASARQVAQHCEDAAGQTRETRTQAEQGATLSTQSASVIRELAESIRNAGDEIAQLAEQAAQISTVIDVIKSIAEQTNLLALNAAIEAARAGEQGRGFAVVADEVRTLATRTQESTREIENTISSLQQVAKQAVTAMNSACDQANTGEKQAIQTGEALTEIRTKIRQISDVIAQVATAGEEQYLAVEEITQNITKVDDAASNLVTNANEVAQSAANVEERSQSLAKTVGAFRI